MAAAHVGLTTENSNDASGTTMTVTRTVTAGNALIVQVAWANNVTCSVNHGDGTYTSARKQDVGTTDHLEVFYFLNSTGGAKTITATFSAGATFRRMNGHEVSGLAASGVLDQTNGATGNGTALSAGNITTTQNDEYLYAGFSHFVTATFTEGTGWTPAGTPGPDGFNEYRIPTATGTFTGNCTASATADWIAIVASFKAEVAAGFDEGEWSPRGTELEPVVSVWG